MPNPVDKILEYATAQVGDPYVWGAEGPDGFDCSGLVYAAYKAAGFDVKRTTANVIGHGGGGYGHVSRSSDLGRAQPGDVLYYDEPGATDHVAIYLGNGQMIEAPTEGVPVRVTKARQPTSVVQPIGGYVADPKTTTVGEEMLSDLNPFDNWAADGLGIALKLAGFLAASALVIIGAREALTEKGS